MLFYSLYNQYFEFYNKYISYIFCLFTQNVSGYKMVNFSSNW